MHKIHSEIIKEVFGALVIIKNEDENLKKCLHSLNEVMELLYMIDKRCWYFVKPSFFLLFSNYIMFISR